MFAGTEGDCDIHDALEHDVVTRDEIKVLHPEGWKGVASPGFSFAYCTAS